MPSSDIDAIAKFLDQAKIAGLRKRTSPRPDSIVSRSSRLIVMILTDAISASPEE
jgi:hypothetical protein